MAEALGMPDAAITDLRTAVTEACANAVLHAYEPDNPGMMEVEAGVEGDALKVSVADFGRGIRPRPDMERSSLRLGLALIAALSHSFEIAGGSETGTRVTMFFTLVPSGDAGNGNGNGNGGGHSAGAESGVPATELAVTDIRLLMPVLSRLVRAIGARHDLSIEKLSDAVLLADAIAAEDPRAADGEPVHVTLDDSEGHIRLRVGPLPAGKGAELRDRLEIPELGASLTSLADEVSLDTAIDGDGPDSAREHLTVAFRTPAPGTR